jgi:hypothetical protein
MPTFDINAAKAAGYSDQEIQQFLQQQATAGVRPSHVVQGGSYAQDQSTPEWQEKYGPLSGMDQGEQVLAGAGRGMVHTARSLGNLVGIVPNSTLQDERQIDAPLLSTGAGNFGNLVGEAAMTAPAGMGIGAAAGRAAPVLAGPIAQGVLQGGAQGLATSDPGERGINTLTGALTGGAFGAGTRVAGAAVHGLHRTPAAQRLLDEGVQLTPGQMYPQGAMNQFEQAGESLPGFKQIIDPAREAAERQYQARVIQAGAAPGSAPIRPSENISDMLQQAYDSYAPLYQQAHGYPVTPSIVRTAGGDIPLDRAFTQAAQAPGVPRSLQNSENAWLQDRLTQLPRNPQSEDLLRLRSDIRQRARNANLKTDTDSGHIANINSRAEQSVTQALQSQLPRDPLQALATADSNYGNYKIIENAVAKSKDNLAGLTPQKLSQAIYDAAADPAYARGAGGPLRDLAKAGTEVFQTVAPPNGSRVATLGVGAAGALHPSIGIPVATGMLGLTGTQTGRRLAAGATAPQRYAQQLIEALNSSIPGYARNVGGQLITRGAVGAGIPVIQQYAPQALAAALMMQPQNH